MTPRSLAIAEILCLEGATTRKTVIDVFQDFDDKSCGSDPGLLVTANREFGGHPSFADYPSCYRTSLRPCDQWIPFAGKIPLGEHLAADCDRLSHFVKLLANPVESAKIHLGVNMVGSTINAVFTLRDLL